MIKIILMSGCGNENMNIMKNYIEDIKNSLQDFPVNIYLKNGNKVDFNLL
jgi:hypothetical protein